VSYASWSQSGSWARPARSRNRQHFEGSLDQCLRGPARVRLVEGDIEEVDEDLTKTPRPAQEDAAEPAPVPLGDQAPAFARRSARERLVEMGLQQPALVDRRELRAFS
jgi:hypothetical protein